MSTLEKGYHHGELRAALLSAAITSLEQGEPFSMRAVARRVGVSQTAPYRHFADRAALDSAVAVEGFKDLERDLSEALAELGEDPSPADALTSLGASYVGFALRRPAVFRLMFGQECDDADSDQVQAAQRLQALLDKATARLFATASPALSVALWSFAHGLASLHLDGKFRPEPFGDIVQRISSAVTALLSIGAAQVTTSQSNNSKQQLGSK